MREYRSVFYISPYKLNIGTLLSVSASKSSKDSILNAVCLRRSEKFLADYTDLK